MNKLFAFLSVLRKGSAVADEVKARGWAAAGGSLSVLIWAISEMAKGLDYDLGITHEAAERIAFGIATVVGVFATFATSKDAGLPVIPPVVQADDPPRDPPVNDVSGA